MPDLSPFDSVCAARMAVYKRLPYFMKMLFKLVPVERLDVLFFGVDEKLRIHYNPITISLLSVEEIASMLAHEVQHPLRRHIERGKEFEELQLRRYTELAPILETFHPALGQGVRVFWNIVADLEINPVVLDAGFKFPDGFEPFFPKTLDLEPGKFAEEYASELFERAEKLKQGGGGQSAPKKNPGATPSPGSAPSKSGGAGPKDEGEGDSEKQGDSPGSSSGGEDEKPKKELKCCGGGCGSVSGNPHPDEASLDESEAPKGATPSETDIARRQVAHDTIEPTEQMKELMGRFGKGRGVDPGMLRWAQAELAPPEVPWQRVLAPLVRDAIAYARGRTDWRIGRPSRRREVLKQTVGEEAPILPTLVGPVPKVLILIDSSGSMLTPGASGRAVFDEALDEVYGVVKATGSPCWAACVDAQVQDWVLLRSKKDLLGLMKGGGGTDMVVGVEAADARGGADVIVLVTDGITPWPKPSQMPKRARLVTCVVGDAKGIPDHIKPLVRVKTEKSKLKRAWTKVRKSVAEIGKKGAA